LQIWNPWDKIFELNPLEIIFFQWSCVAIKRRGSEGISARQSNRGGELKLLQIKRKGIERRSVRQPNRGGKLNYCKEVFFLGIDFWTSRCIISRKLSILDMTNFNEFFWNVCWFMCEKHMHVIVNICMC